MMFPSHVYKMGIPLQPGSFKNEDIISPSASRLSPCAFSQLLATKNCYHSDKCVRR